jgi:V/A-type H+-transporting ATPase subunit E
LEVKVSLLAILNAIRASGEAQVQDIEENTYHKVHKIQVNARLNAEQITEEAYTETVAPAFRERARILHHARLESLQIAGNKREDLVDTALDQIQGHLAGMRTDIVYPEVLRKLVRETLDELSGSLEAIGRARLEADPRDQELLENILSNMELNLDINCNLDCWGGLIAKSQDGRVVVINTLEARLERATPYLRRYLAALFESEAPESERSYVVEMVGAS